MLALAAALYDLEKAFDKVNREKAWQEVEKIANEASLAWVLEELYDGTCYMLKDAKGCIKTRILISKGVRQGSKEGPPIFLALYHTVSVL